MKIDPALREMLESRGVELIEQDTARAVHEFNRLWQEGRHVSAGFHLTCGKGVTRYDRVHEG